MEDERKKFEARFSASPFEWDFERFPEGSAWPGNYKDYNVQCAWEGWEEAAEAANKELAVLRKGLNDRVKVEEEIRRYAKSLDTMGLINLNVLRDWANRLGIPEEFRPKRDLDWSPDRGPWQVGHDTKEVFIWSEDFYHDVRLYVNGDFATYDDKLEYAKDIARRLNRLDEQP
jgi:hypothetical protein